MRGGGLVTEQPSGSLWSAESISAFFRLSFSVRCRRSTVQALGTGMVTSNGVAMRLVALAVHSQNFFLLL